MSDKFVYVVKHQLPNGTIKYYGPNGNGIDDASIVGCTSLTNAKQRLTSLKRKYKDHDNWKIMAIEVKEHHEIEWNSPILEK